MNICPFCKAEDKASRLTPSPVSTGTLMASSPGYFDERGEWVRGRDPNWYTRDYFCSQGHHFSVTQREGEADQVRLISTLTHAAAVSLDPEDTKHGN